MGRFTVADPLMRPGARWSLHPVAETVAV